MVGDTSYRPGDPCWIDLGTPDIDGAKAFYAALLGWRPEPAPNAGAAGDYTFFHLGAGDAGAAGAAMPITVAGQPPAWTTYISVADADQTAAAASTAGGRVLMEPMDVFDQGRMALLGDPQDAVIGVWQPRDFAGLAATERPGAYCWSELACRDAAAAREFYGAVFGWRAQAKDFGGARYTEWHGASGLVAGMIEMDEQWPAEIVAHWMVYFAVADCDEVAGRAADLGGRVCVPPSDIPVGRFAVLDDPQGATFSVITMAAPG